MNLFSKFILIAIFLSLFISVSRSDFIGIIIPMLIYIVFLTTFKNDVLRNLNRFILALGINLAYDLFWILINLKVCIKL